MNQEIPRLLRGGNDLAFTRNSTPTNSDENRILIENEDDDDDDDSSAPEAGYSRPFLFVDMIWNMAFVAVSVFVLVVTLGERPSTPLRLWLFGYALQCLLHVGFVWDDYQTRCRHHGFTAARRQDSYFPTLFFCRNSVIKKLESINTIVSSVWWVFGFYWIVIGGQPLLQESPRLYWLSVVFLAFDVFFMIFCFAMACIIFLLLFCCFPILATVAYAMTIGDGASENDIKSLPKYLYRPQHAVGVFEDEKERVSLTAVEAAELALHPEDSECCICLSKYVDGAELCSLPCKHHFHHKCITKWLRINATCPLCKFNILRGDTLV